MPVSELYNKEVTATRRSVRREETMHEYVIGTSASKETRFVMASDQFRSSISTAIPTWLTWST